MRSRVVRTSLVAAGLALVAVPLAICYAANDKCCKATLTSVCSGCQQWADPADDEWIQFGINATSFCDKNHPNLNCTQELKVCFSKANVPIYSENTCKTWKRDALTAARAIQQCKADADICPGQ